MFTVYDARAVAELEAKGYRIVSDPQPCVVRGRPGFGVFYGSKMVAWAPERWAASARAHGKGYHTLTAARLDLAQGDSNAE